VSQCPLKKCYLRVTTQVDVAEVTAVSVAKQTGEVCLNNERRIAVRSIRD